MTCGSCGHVNHERARFCDQCGTALSRSGSAVGEHKIVTVLFADVRGSMALAETLGAERWRTLLDRFLRIMNDGVRRFGGTVNQYTGDGVMALFGAPLALEDHAHRACLAAIAVRDRIRLFADEIRRAKGIEFAVRLGLHSGDVVVGTIGDALHEAYTAQGHTVGLAQRIEQLASPNSAFVSQATAALVTLHFDLRDAGEFRLKGVTEPIRVFELERARRDRSRVDAAPVRTRTRFIGRTTELARLVQAVDEAIAGRGSVLGVVGEPGVGKTRLCAELLRYARAHDMMLARTHCPAHAAEVRLLPIVELLRSFFRIRSGEPAAARDKVQRRLSALRASLVEQVPIFWDLLGLAEPDAPTALDADERQAQRVACVRRLIQTQSAQRPLLLVIDDAHCMDETSNQFVGEIVDALGWTRTLLLINYRPGYHADWMEVPYWSEVNLTTLADQDVDALLLALMGDDPSTDPVRQLIRAAAGGNPFFVEELVQSLIERQIVVRATSATGSAARRRLRLQQSVDEVSLPATVQALLAARIDRLPQRARAILQVAAVIGRNFSAELLQHALPHIPAEHGFGSSSEDVATMLALLEQGAFIRSERGSDVAFAFRHPLTQAVSYSAPLVDTRNALHVAVARALEQLFAEQLGQHAEVIGHHYRAAGWTHSAARWRNRAALRVTNITLPRKRSREGKGTGMS